MSAMGTQTRPLPESQREKQYPLDQSEAISRSRAGDPPARDSFEFGVKKIARGAGRFRTRADRDFRELLDPSSEVSEEERSRS
jgi:hypothetical protein